MFLCISCLVVVAECSQWAAFAERTPRVTERAAMFDEIQMSLVKLVRRDDRLQIDVRLFRRYLWPDQAEALRDAVDVRIHRESRLVESE